MNSHKYKVVSALTLVLLFLGTMSAVFAGASSAPSALDHTHVPRPFSYY